MQGKTRKTWKNDGATVTLETREFEKVMKNCDRCGMITQKLKKEGVFMLKGKTVVLGVCGGIAAYKIANLASMLGKLHADVHVIMTENAKNFITPITFETLTGNKCLTDTFDRNFQFEVEHVELAKRADVVMIAPATANVIAKLAHGIADDMLTTTLLACTCPKIVAPSMNTRMLENPITQDNIHRLETYGFSIIEPAVGMLACKDTGKGKLPKEELLLEAIVKEIALEKDMKGMKVLVTAGPTRESLDPVRFLTNHSSGKMGYALARVAMLRGAEVTLVTGQTAIAPPAFVNVVPITTARQLFTEVTSRAKDQDIIVKAAAVADYRPAQIATEKVKKSDDELSIPLSRTEDTLQYLGDHKIPGQLLCGFAMETTDMEAHATAKLEKKHLDMIVANNVKVEGAGFGTDTNVVTIITKDDKQQLEPMTKEEVSVQIFDRLLAMKE